MKTDIVIIGGGPAGLAAALSAKAAGVSGIIIIERDKELGGILNQCIHNGFGLHTFQEELTGPEYAQRYVHMVGEQKIEYRLNSMVINIRRGDNDKKYVSVMGRKEGLYEIETKAVVLAMGCRERPRGALNTPGYRPAGIYCAGTAQHFVNIEGRMPGKEIVILGSGDIGLIMARRLTLEGAHVQAVAEIMPYSGGLQRNIVQCLEDYKIPLMLSHTVVDIQGKERVEGVTLAMVDERLKPIPGTEKQIACDTLLLSVGLIPENELSADLGIQMDQRTNGPIVRANLETNVPGVFACGNVLHVHDLVDNVSKEAEKAGLCAAAYVQGMQPAILKEKPEGGEALGKSEKKRIGENSMICICCPIGCEMTVIKDAKEGFQISGNRCPRGSGYAQKELINPTRTLTSAVQVIGGSAKTIPVKSRQEIPKNMLLQCMKELKKLRVTPPVHMGDVLLENIAQTGAEIVATKELLY